jgi:hypothetical protein
VFYNKIADEISNSINTENQKEETNDEPIYVMTLALEQGKSEKIEIYANSDPAELAYDFCNKNNLDFNALDYLKEQITNLLESYAKNENNENEENDNIEENNTENINVPEIEEIQEDQEFNITENTKSQKTETKDLNNNRDNINSVEKENEEIKKNEAIDEINLDNLQNKKNKF